MCLSGGREYPPGGVSTPGHGQGEGPVGYKFPPEAGTQETMGGAGAKRSPPGGYSLPTNSNTTDDTRQMKVTSSQSDFWVTFLSRFIR